MIGSGKGIVPDKAIFALSARVKSAFIFAVASKSTSCEFMERKARFQVKIHETFQHSRLQGHHNGSLATASMLKIIATISTIQVIAIAIGFMRSKMMAVLLGPEGVGVIGIIDQFIQLIAQLSAFSIPFAVVKFLSRSHSDGFDAFKRSYANFLRLLLLLTITGATIGLGIVFWYPNLLGSQLLAYRSLLILGMLSVPIITLHGFFMHVLAAAGKATAAAWMQVTIALVLTTAALIGISVAGILGFYWSNLLAGILIIIGTLIYLRKRLNLPFLDGSHDIWTELHENYTIVTFSLILYITTFTYSLANFMARYGVLTHFGEVKVGLLQAAFTLSGSLSLLVNPANGLYLTPILNRDSGKVEKLQAAVEFQRKLTIAVGALAMPMVLFPQWLLILLFSSAFVEVSQIIFLFVTAQCIVQLAGVYQALMIGLDDLKVYGATVAVGHLTFGALSWVLASQYGILGVAIGSLISSVIIFLATLARLSLKHGLTLPPGLLSLMGGGLLALLLAGAFYNQYDAWNPLVILSKFGLYVLFVISLLFFLSQAELQHFIRRSRLFLTRSDRQRWKHTMGHVYRRIAETFFSEV